MSRCTLKKMLGDFQAEGKCFQMEISRCIRGRRLTKNANRRVN
jgi:hypothetical protein